MKFLDIGWRKIVEIKFLSKFTIFSCSIYPLYPMTSHLSCIIPT